MATVRSIASLLGDSILEAHSLASPRSRWGEVTAAPWGDGASTQLHLLSIQKTSPVTPQRSNGSLPSVAIPGDDTEVFPLRRRELRAADSVHIELPKQIGPFRIGRRLARGGMSEVVEAWDIDRRKSVALKLMRPSGSGRRAEREAWDREISILRGMKHPGVVPLLDYGIGEGGELFLAMPLLQGCSARDELVAMRRAGGAAQTATTYDRLLPAFLDICDTLEYVHQSGVLHCDLKPSNIFLPRERTPNHGLLLDWGVSVVRRTAGSQPGEGGRPGGTPGYMAPEQITGPVGVLDPATDVYGLGCLLYEFITWRPLIRRGDPRRALRDALRGELIPPELRQSDVQVPKALSDICMKALATRKTERYSTAAELATAVRDLLKA